MFNKMSAPRCLISILLCLCLIISVIPLYAFSGKDTEIRINMISDWNTAETLMQPQPDNYLLRYGIVKNTDATSSGNISYEDICGETLYGVFTAIGAGHEEYVTVVDAASLDEGDYYLVVGRNPMSGWIIDGITSDYSVAAKLRVNSDGSAVWSDMEGNAVNELDLHMRYPEINCFTLPVDLRFEWDQSEEYVQPVPSDDAIACLRLYEDNMEYYYTKAVQEIRFTGVDTGRVNFTNLPAGRYRLTGEVSYYQKDKWSIEDPALTRGEIYNAAAFDPPYILIEISPDGNISYGDDHSSSYTAVYKSPAQKLGDVIINVEYEVPEQSDPLPTPDGDTPIMTIYAYDADGNTKLAEEKLYFDAAGSKGGTVSFNLPKGEYRIMAHINDNHWADTIMKFPFSQKQSSIRKTMVILS